MSKIETQELHLYYGDFHALKGITLSVEANSITALIGPSGCGKSTYLRTLNRMNDLIEGVRIEGKTLLDDNDIYASAVDVTVLRKQVGMVFQKPVPFPQSIIDNAAFGMRVNNMGSRKQIEEKAINALQQAFLWEEVKGKLRKPATDLSIGQQQRLCIARTLAIEPEVILMDEPTSALDPVATAKIEELIVELKKHYTLLVVTHNMQQAHRISDKTAVFYAGELDEYGPTAQVFDNPASPRTRQYIGGKFG